MTADIRVRFSVITLCVELVGIVVAMEAEINELKGTDGDVQ